MPISPSEKRTLLERYNRNGFVVVPSVFAPLQLLAIKHRIAREVDALATTLARAGRIENTHAGQPLQRRLALLGSQCDVAKRSWGDCVQGPELHGIVTNVRLLDAVETLLGRSGFAFHGSTCRPKLPVFCEGSERASQPYHQDSQYFDSDESGRVSSAVRGEPSTSTANMHIISCWLPLCDCNAENGQLYFLPGSHKFGLQGGQRDGNGNMRSDADPSERFGVQAVGVPVSEGCAILFSNLTFHGSGLNYTHEIRWSLDWRYSAHPHSEQWSEMTLREQMATIEWYRKMRAVDTSFGRGMVVRGQGTLPAQAWEVKWRDANASKL